jgi:hypothetical protein
MQIKTTGDTTAPTRAPKVESSDVAKTWWGRRETGSFLHHQWARRTVFAILEKQFGNFFKN